MDRIFGLKLKEGMPRAEIDQEALDLIKEREAARKNRDFSRADEIRDLLLERGIVLKDTPDGTKWARKL
jgi:cysteinyl-tRNA synthetase